MNIDLSIEQTRAWDGLNDHDNGIKRVLFGGQAGGGKSFIISLWQIHQRLKYPATRGYLGREVLKRLKETTVVTLLDVARSLGVEVKYNSVDGYIDFPNGSRILLLELSTKPSDPNFDSLGSLEFTDGAIDEGVQVSQRATDLLLSRTRYKHDKFCGNCGGNIKIETPKQPVKCSSCGQMTNGLKSKQLITCNPSPSWIKDEIVVPHFENRLKSDTIFVPASLDSNPNKQFVDNYKDTLSALTNEFDKARLLHGDWFAEPKTGGEFYKEFTEENNVEPLEYDPAEPLHISFDFNVNPYMTATVHQFTDKHLKQIDEFCLKSPRNTTPAICRAIVKKYNTHESGVFIYGDPAGRHKDTRNERGYNDFDLIRQGLAQFHPKLRVDKSAPPIVMRGNFINSLFANRISGCSFTIDKNCEHTIGDYNFVKEDQDGKKHKKKITDAETGIRYEKRGHTSDANDYLICRIFADEFKRYSRGNKPINRTLSPSKTVHKF